MSSPKRPRHTNELEHSPDATADESQDDSSQEDDEADRLPSDFEFSCRMESAKELHSLLSCLSSFKANKRDQNAQVEVTEDEVVFMVRARSKHTQVTGTIGKTIFSAFKCSEKGGTFCINLGTLMECLGIFGQASLQSTTVTMEFESQSAAFVVTLEEGGVFTTCSLDTIDSDVYASENWSQMSSAFNASPQVEEDFGALNRFSLTKVEDIRLSHTSAAEVCKAILKSEHLKEALYELQDLQGAASVRVVMSSSAPFFQLSSEGNLGSLEIEFGKSSELFVFFDCDGGHQWEYPLNSLLHGMRALVVAAETFLRINDEGIMCIQHQIVAASGKKCYVDFLMVPSLEEEEEEEEEGEDHEDAYDDNASNEGEPSRFVDSAAGPSTMAAPNDDGYDEHHQFGQSAKRHPSQHGKRQPEGGYDSSTDNEDDDDNGSNRRRHVGHSSALPLPPVATSAATGKISRQGTKSKQQSPPHLSDD